MLVGVALLAGLIRGFAGFGAGLVMAPGFAAVLPPALAVPSLVLLDLLASARLVPSAIGRAHIATVVPLGAAALVGIPLGSWILLGAAERPLRVAISLIVLLFAALLAVAPRRRSTPRGPALAAIGGLSGLLTGSMGIGGPPAILLLLSGPRDADDARADLITFIGLTQTVVVITYLLQGLLGLAALGLAALLTVPFVAALLLGEQLFRRSERRNYRPICLVAIAAIALGGLALALR